MKSLGGGNGMYLVLLGCVLLSPRWADGQEAATPSESRRGPTDVVEFGAFVDGVMKAHMEDKHVAGATFVMVLDGKPFFAKGYGLADVAAKKPVDPDATMFRIGSVSKLFTWTAVMQLAEQGQLDLDADINTYLQDFKIPPTYDKPITLKHLLSHTPGFEDHSLGLFARSADDVEPLGKVLDRDLPARVRPPGVLASYSNHGTALAGYIVAQVSQMPWEDYVEKNILEPLAMRHTSVRQPPADELSADMSKGYRWTRGQFKEQGFEYVPIAPAGSMASSAGDMAHFLIAHLQNGRYGDARILRDETARQMHGQLFTHDPSQPGMAYGFMRLNYNGHEVVEHGGDTFLFHSQFMTLPEHNAGYFVSYNTDSGAGLREKLFEAIMDRYWPASDTPSLQPADDFSDTLSRYTGSYGAIRHSYTSILKLGALVGVAKVSADGDTLVLDGSTRTLRFAQVAPLVFREINGQHSLAFREDPSGRITHLFVAAGPAVALERLSRIETPEFNVTLLCVCAAIFLSAVIGWPVIAFVTREKPSGPVGEAIARSSAGSRAASLVGWLAAVLALTVIGLALIPFMDAEEFAYGVPALMNALLWSTPVVTALVLATLAGAVAAWRFGYWRLSGRIHYTSVVVAGLAFVWFLNHWNLLRFGA
jgi:CubicO group peptidase (beta-lactamase class C family)